MGLEKVFVAARTLEWLRSGPLGHLADGYCDWLMIQGFSRSWARTHLRYAFLLNAHLGAAVGRPGTRVGAGDVEGFLRAYRQGVRNRRTRAADPRRVRYSIRRFVQYLRTVGRFDE